MRPDDLFDRDAEWADLERFATSTAPGVHLGILYGRRRQGKSFMLRRLAAQTGGLYHMAVEEEPGPALQRFADAMAGGRGLAPGQLHVADWADALRTALAGDQDPIIIDELPYLMANAPGRAIPSVLQSLIDAGRDAAATSGGKAESRHVIVCGSSLSVMSELLSGTKALRGRAELDIQLHPFDYRQTAEFYGVEDPVAALRLYAILGGTPGYRDLLGEASPQTTEALESLVLDTVGNPSHALFSEAEYLLREDPRIVERSLYHSVLGAVASGAHTPTAVGQRIGRPASALAHALDVLVTAGFLLRREDVLRQRRPVLEVADPIVRFTDLVVGPFRPVYEDRRGALALARSQDTLRSKIYGPTFERVAREWVSRYASPATVGGVPGHVGSTVVNDSRGRSQFEVDVVALAADQPLHGPHPRVLAVGEAKDSDAPRTSDDVARLERIRELLVERGVEAAAARLLIIGRSGFDAGLTKLASSRDDVELVDLARLRRGE